MSIEDKVVIALVAILAAFATGRYSVSTAPAVKTVETVKTDTDTKTDKDIHKTTVIVKQVSGATTTTITEDTNTNTDRRQDSVTHLDQTITPPKLSTLNLSALVGTDPLDSFKVIYGLSVNKQVLGPVTVGVWGLTNSTFGLSVGLNF